MTSEKKTDPGISNAEVRVRFQGVLSKYIHTNGDFLSEGRSEVPSSASYCTYGLRRNFITDFLGRHLDTRRCARVRNNIEASLKVFDQVDARRERHNNWLKKKVIVGASRS
jgi:hypothetical protein